MSDTNASPPPPDPAAQPPYGQQQPAYDQDPYGYAQQPYPAQPRYNTMAIIGFVLSIVVSVVGIVLSFIALSQIKRTGEQGRGLAIAGIIIGFAQVLIGIIVTIIVFVVFGVAATQYQYNP
jgi:peptidyl-prolyl cis-trans isomerase B (cyclophilin B)